MTETRAVNIRFERETFNRLAEVANQKGLTVAGLIRMWAMEKVQELEK